jgi:hypothetical protein
MQKNMLIFCENKLFCGPIYAAQNIPKESICIAGRNFIRPTLNSHSLKYKQAKLLII